MPDGRGLLGRLFRPRIPTDDAVAFVERHLPGDLWSAPQWSEFRAHVAAHDDVAAQRAYRRLTGAGWNECHLAVQVARRTGG